jgi:hypothetical protein
VIYFSTGSFQKNACEEQDEMKKHKITVIGALFPSAQKLLEESCEIKLWDMLLI